MDPQRPGETPVTPPPVTARPPSPPPPPAPPTPPLVRNYPKPPALLPRMLFLCLKPEFWPTAARYPTHVTLIPLILAIIISACTIGISEGIRFNNAMHGFASALSPMQLAADGTLKPTVTPAAPQVFIYPPFRFVIDTDPKSAAETAKDENINAILFTDHDIIAAFVHNPDFYHPTYKSIREFFGELSGTPAADQKDMLINGDFIRTYAPLFSITGAFIRSLGQFIGDALWSAAIIFFVGPLIALIAAMGDRRLLLPRRAAYRMAIAILVPLILFNALMHAAGYPISSVIPDYLRFYFWFLAATALAVWTALLAKKMYAPLPRKMPRQS